jgi:hypothetical protein
VDFYWQLQSISLLHDCTHKTNKTLAKPGEYQTPQGSNFFYAMDIRIAAPVNAI